MKKDKEEPSDSRDVREDLFWVGQPNRQNGKEFLGRQIEQVDSILVGLAISRRDLQHDSGPGNCDKMCGKEFYSPWMPLNLSERRVNLN